MNNMKLTIVIASLMLVSGSWGLRVPLASAASDETPEAIDLDTLARVFNEQPASTPRNGLIEAVTCGAEGHCSYTACPSFDCPEDNVKTCTCEASGSCDDVHNPWNPFDNDQHTAYSCSCECKPNPSQPEDCLVYDPRNPEYCLIGDGGCEEGNMTQRNYQDCIRVPQG